MNPDEAYRLHTDWARAASRAGEPQGNWLEQRCRKQSQPLMPRKIIGDPQNTLVRVLGERWTFEGLLRSGPVQQTQMVVGWQPDDGPEQMVVPADVFPEVDESTPGPLSTSSTSVVIPTHLHVDVTRQALASAPTYYVSRDMVTVLEVAAEALDEFDMMPRLPSSRGFVVLAEPIMLPMPGMAPQPVRAFGWTVWGEVSTSTGQTGEAGEVWTFASRSRDGEFAMVQEARDAWPSKTAWRNDPDLLPCYADIVVTGTTMPPTRESYGQAQAREKATSMLIAQAWQVTPEGKDIELTPEVWSARVAQAQAKYDQYLAEQQSQVEDQQVGNFQRYLAAFVLLLTQQVTRPKATPVPHSDVRLARKVSPQRPAEVTVVDLKPTGHRSQEPGEHARGPLTSRHLVGSHWKWQPYGPERALRRRIFVAGYVRGPEDAPLVVKPKVGRL